MTTAEYRYRIPPVGLMFSILLPGLIVGGFLAYRGYAVAGFAVTAIFGFGTVPAVRLLGLREEHTYLIGPDGLTIAVTPVFGSTQRRAIAWTQIAALEVRTQSERNESHSSLAVHFESGKRLTVPADYPGFAEWLKQLQKHVPHLGYTWAFKGET